MTSVVDLEIDGLAGRKDKLIVELNSDVNIFFGLNGTGKTSLLRIIHSAIRDNSSLLADVPFSSARVRIYSKSKEAAYQRSLRRASGGTRGQNSDDDAALFDMDTSTHTANIRRRVVERERRRVPPWTTSPKNPALKPLRVSFLTTNRLASDLTDLSGIARSHLANDDDVDAIFADHIQSLWRGYTNKVLAKVRAIQERGLAEILRSVVSASQSDSIPASLTPKTAFARTNQFLSRQGTDLRASTYKDFAAHYQDSPHVRSVVRDIDTIERQIESAEEPRRRLSQLVQQFMGPDKEVSFTDRGIYFEAHGNNIPLTSMSSGEKQLVRILLEAIRNEGDTFIIDEPELSMHIDWQRNLVEAIRLVSPQCQIIMATHSPEIMANISDDKIFRL